MEGSLVRGIYDAPLDRASAYEILQQRAEQAAAAEAAAPRDIRPHPQRRSGSRQTPFEAFAKSALRSVGTQLGRSLVRGILGSLSGGRRR
jgi:hypothetical protein